MRTATPTHSELTRAFTPTRSPLLQRKCDCGKSTGLSGQCSDCQKKKLLQRRSSHSKTETSEVPPIVHEVLRSSGQPLDGETRSQMEARFNQDFSHVRVHTDPRAAESAQAVQALAYTVGRDIVFASGQYVPHTAIGKKVLAHELTHVLQQRSMSHATLAPLKLGRADDAYEREADAQAEKVVSTQDAIAPLRQRTQPLVQRLGDISQRPAALSCPLPVAATPAATDSILFPNSGTSLSPLQRAQIQNFVVNWRAAGASATVRLDGFASQVGADGRNWTLSCDRAQAVAAELRSPSSGTVPGIPGGFIQVFAQGETAEFGAEAQNRRVTLHLPAPALPETITSETVATTPGARTRTTIGVGEEVNLTHAPGSAAWSATAGTVSAANGVTVLFTAPDTAQRVGVRAGAATIEFDVIAPTSVAMDREPGTGVKHNVNQPDSGVQTRVFLGPDTVNFNKVIYRELDVAGVATAGVYSCNPAGTGHCGAGGGGAPCPDKLMTNTVVAAMGTQSVLGDCAYSGHCGTAPPFVAGILTITIPYEYKVGAGAFRRFATVVQLHMLAADSSTLISTKAGATGTTTVASATLLLPQCP